VVVVVVVLVVAALHGPIKFHAFIEDLPYILVLRSHINDGERDEVITNHFRK
jgi:hypothetical protein